MKDKVALITGAGGPMGRAIARRLAEEGASLVLTDISANRLDEAVTLTHEALAEGADIAARRSNATVAAEILPVAELALGRVGRVDVLVNLVGGLRGDMYVPLLDISDERWGETLQLNLRAGIHLARALVPGMRERGWGRVVNISSVAYAGELGQADYGAAKAAVASLSRSMAIEFAPQVNVNCIAPSLIRTSVVERMDAAELADLRDRTLLKRLGGADEIANAGLFFSCDESSFVTGQLLAVSGGMAVSL
jgi:NAD(P)-dependent dehydrogenase (short-subunit alcohol dehydrogenase family)